MKTALIIPAYKPGQEMLALLRQFQGNEDFVPLVVDDGSGAEFEPIFQAIPQGTVLLRHGENRGKGRAMKTAMEYVLAHMPQCEYALTADADGQHRYDDILRVNDAVKAHPKALVLGSRRFDGDVPFRSRAGNAITRGVFALASGHKVYDTQTGLRAFGREAMERFIQVDGERYEYEINQLLDAAQSGMEIFEETIQTVYLDENKSSHFNVFRDSFKIYACILKFVSSSLLAFLIDFVLVLLLKSWTHNLLLSVVVARVISAAFNFTFNRQVVFKSQETVGRSLAKYALLACAVLVSNYLLLHLLNEVIGMPLAVAKILVEIVLFFFNYIIQGRFVYHKGKRSAA